jgi:hypothetical protein
MGTPLPNVPAGEPVDGGAVRGRAVFMRTDRPDFAEKEIPFGDFEEMFRLCIESKKNLILQRIILDRELDGKPCQVVLDYMSATCGSKVTKRVKP